MKNMKSILKISTDRGRANLLLAELKKTRSIHNCYSYDNFCMRLFDFTGNSYNP